MHRNFWKLLLFINVFVFFLSMNYMHNKATIFFCTEHLLEVRLIFLENFQLCSLYHFKTIVVFNYWKRAYCVLIKAMSYSLFIILFFHVLPYKSNICSYIPIYIYWAQNFDSIFKVYIFNEIVIIVLGNSI